MGQGSLILVGSGIKSLAQLTNEAIAYIKESNKILYALNEPIIENWIKKNNPNAESLCIHEEKHTLRSEAYQAMTNYIVAEVKKNQQVCAVFYGHPTLFAKSGLDAVSQLKQQGLFTKILPGISAEACLFADLAIDPGVHGYQSYEATDFLIHQKKITTTSHLMLWQIGMLGHLGFVKTNDNNQNLYLLKNYLLNFYHAEKDVIIYEAALYPHLNPKIYNCALKHITNAPISTLSTLYISPSEKPQINLEILKQLHFNIQNISNN